MTLTAVLFAGGTSRRMGADKASLVFAGEPLWSRQLRLLRELRPEVLWVSARARPVWCPADIEVVPDDPPARGPLSGLAAVLRNLKTSHLLALAVDLPQMTAGHLRQLRSLVSSGCGVISQSGDFYEPLCAVYPAEAAAAAQAMLSGNDAALHSLVGILLRENRMRTHPLGDAERPLYRNVNTPADLPA